MTKLMKIYYSKRNYHLKTGLVHVCDYRNCLRLAKFKVELYDRNFNRKEKWYLCEEHSKLFS